MLKCVLMHNYVFSLNIFKITMLSYDSMHYMSCVVLFCFFFVCLFVVFLFYFVSRDQHTKQKKCCTLKTNLLLFITVFTSPGSLPQTTLKVFIGETCIIQVSHKNVWENKMCPNS